MATERIKGLTDLLGQLNDLAHLVDDQELENAVYDGWNIVENEMRKNALSADHDFTGLLVDPQTMLTRTYKDPETGKIVGEAGVFHHDATMARYNVPGTDRKRDPKKDIPPPVYAFWLEFGTQPHYLHTGLRARKTPVDPSNKVEDRIHPGIKPSHFISNAFASKSDTAARVMDQQIGLLIDKVTK